jgi:ATP-dependent DNA ligase
MKSFAALIEGLVYMPSRNGKLRLLADHFEHTPDPDRGWALAALTGSLTFAAAKASTIRNLAIERVDEALFGWSYDFVGDLAETVALIWPSKPGANREPTITEVVEELRATSRAAAPLLIERWLDALAASERFALLKLITGALRIGVSARLAKVALAEWGGQPVDEIEELWHALEPPYEELFVWLSGQGPKPEIGDRATFRPLMLAHPLEAEDIAALDPAAYRAEWKWDGIRVQVVGRGDRPPRIYSRSGDDVTGAFPDLADTIRFHAVLDGELLVARDGVVAPFNDLQQRLNRKAISARMMAEYPAWVRLYDILFEGEEDLRPLPLDARRVRLDSWIARERPARMDLSPMIPFESWDELAALRDGPGDRGADAEAGRQRLCRRPAERPLVQVEARRPDPRHRADVRPARPRQTLLLLLRLHLRHLADGGRGRAAGAGGQSLFRLHRRGAGTARPLGAQPHDQALRTGARGRAASGAGGRLRQRPPLHPPQIRSRDAIPPSPPHPLGQTGGGSRSAGNAGTNDRRVILRFNSTFI